MSTTDSRAAFEAWQREQQGWLYTAEAEVGTFQEERWIAWQAATEAAKATGTAMSKVFKGSDGLKKLADADAFWEQQPYGTRFYFGNGIADYLHREVLRAAVSDISAAPRLEIERLRDQQAERVMPMVGPLLDAFEGTQRGELKDISASLEHWLSKINQAMVAEECSDCEGTGMRDSGGVQPWGEGINVPCDCEAAQQPAPALAVNELAKKLNALDMAIAHSTNLTPHSKPRRLLAAIIHEVCSDAALAATAAPVLSDEQIDHIARSYFADEHGQTKAKGVIHDALRQVGVADAGTVKEAERYRYLRSVVYPEKFYASGHPSWVIRYHLRGETFDSAVDHAILAATNRSQP